jgi:hypothetical protein
MRDLPRGVFPRALPGSRQPQVGKTWWMGVTDFQTKAAVVIRDDLAVWQRLNVCAFLMSGLVGSAGPDAIGEEYLDADANRYLPLLVQPVLVFEADGPKLKLARERAARRGVPIALYTAEMFATGNDADNRAAVRAVAAADLDIVGLALRAPHRDADAVLRGFARHP